MLNESLGSEQYYVIELVCCMSVSTLGFFEGRLLRTADLA